MTSKRLDVIFLSVCEQADDNEPVFNSAQTVLQKDTVVGKYMEKEISNQ